MSSDDKILDKGQNNMQKSVIGHIGDGENKLSRVKTFVGKNNKLDDRPEELLRNELVECQKQIKKQLKKFFIQKFYDQFQDQQKET